jgi:glycosyltransferase involved in cell wall biosynthesis
MISFVIPAYNEEELIADCIGSIRYAVALAKIKEYEIIVVDNNSTDNTSNRAKGLGAKVISEKRKGVTRARQAGLEAARYELVAFIDADNFLPEEWVRFALATMDDRKVVAAAGPLVYHDLGLGKRLTGFLFYLFAKAVHYVLPMTTGGNCILRKSALVAVGGFNTEIDFYGDDTDTAVRLSKVGKVKFDLDLWTFSSARRMEAEGFFVIGLRYIANWAWIWIFGKPLTTSYYDHRPK